MTMTRQRNPFYRRLCEILGVTATYSDKSGKSGRRRYCFFGSADHRYLGKSQVMWHHACREAMALCKEYGVDCKQEVLDGSRRSYMERRAYTPPGLGADGLPHPTVTVPTGGRVEISPSDQFNAYFDPDCPRLWTLYLARTNGMADNTPPNALIDYLEEKEFDPALLEKYRQVCRAKGLGV